MPLYLYRCDGCGKEVDRIVSIDERDDPCWHGEAVEGEACWGRMRYQYRPGNIHMNQYVRPRAERQAMKAANQIDPGNASYDEVAKFQDGQRKGKEARLDNWARKKAEEFVTEYGEAIYTSENQNRSDVVEKPKGLPDHIIKPVVP